MFFYWDDKNEEHIGIHGVERWEAEQVVRRAKRPYPKKVSSVKWTVKGRTIGGRPLQVIFVERPADQIDIGLLGVIEKAALERGEAATYVIHARELRRGET